MAKDKLSASDINDLLKRLLDFQVDFRTSAEKQGAHKEALSNLKTGVGDLWTEMNKIKEQMTKIRIKVGMIGAVSGFLGWLVPILIKDGFFG